MHITNRGFDYVVSEQESFKRSPAIFIHSHINNWITDRIKISQPKKHRHHLNRDRVFEKWFNRNGYCKGHPTNAKITTTMTKSLDYLSFFISWLSYIMFKLTLRLSDMLLVAGTLSDNSELCLRDGLSDCFFFFLSPKSGEPSAESILVVVVTEAKFWLNLGNEYMAHLVNKIFLNFHCDASFFNLTLHLMFD